MRQLLRILLGLFATTVAPAFGQGMTLVGSGYSDPSIIRVAPGQIITFFVAGLKTILANSATATSLPLPKTLAGMSVTFTPETSGLSYSAPLLAVRQMNSCGYGGTPPPSSPSQDCLITGITVQVPFELSPVPNGGNGLPADLVITENGNVSKAFRVYPQIDNLHVVNTCDPFPALPFDSSCGPAVTHADGTLVTASSPAKPGETVVIYVFGLGQTTPAVKTGEPTPTPAVLGPAILGSVRTVAVQFDFRPNAAPSFPYLTIQAVISPTPVTGPVATAPTYVGLTPGQVGVYQINLPLPSTFSAVQPCTTLSVCAGNPASCPLPIRSNLTIDIGGVSSFDGAAICVQPPQ